MRNSATSAGCATLGIVLPRESTTKKRRARSIFCSFFRFLHFFVVYFSSFQCVGHCDMKDSTGKVAQPAEVARVRQRAI